MVLRVERPVCEPAAGEVDTHRDTPAAIRVARAVGKVLGLKAMVA